MVRRRDQDLRGAEGVVARQRREDRGVPAASAAHGDQADLRLAVPGLDVEHGDPAAVRLKGDSGRRVGWPDLEWAARVRNGHLSDGRGRGASESTSVPSGVVVPIMTDLLGIGRAVGLGGRVRCDAHRRRTSDFPASATRPGPTVDAGAGPWRVVPARAMIAGRHEPARRLAPDVHTYWRPARGRLLESHGRGNSKWRIRTSSGRMQAWPLYRQWRLPLDSPKVPMTPRLITADSAKGSVRQQVLF